MSNRLAFAALAVACIAAAAGGGYLATRQNAVPTPAAAQSNPVAENTAAPAPAASAMPPAPVQETEAVVGDKTAADKADRSDKSDRLVKTPPAEPKASTTPKRTDARRNVPANAREGAATAKNEQPPALANTWPSSAAQQAQTPPPAPEAPRVDDHAAQEPPRPAEPPKPAFEELVIPRDSVIGLQTDNRISTDTARLEDRVDAHVTRDVKVGDRVAIPAGSRVIGAVTQVERGGKFKEQARLGIRFHTIVLGDGNRLPISTETIVRLGDAPGNGTAAKVGGGAVGGAILGAILGGAKGAAIGATAGAGAGTAAVAAGDRSAVVLAPGTPLTPRILSPVTVTVEQDRN